MNIQENLISMLPRIGCEAFAVLIFMKAFTQSFKCLPQKEDIQKGVGSFGRKRVSPISIKQVDIAIAILLVNGLIKKDGKNYII